MLALALHHAKRMSRWQTLRVLSAIQKDCELVIILQEPLFTNKKTFVPEQKKGMSHCQKEDIFSEDKTEKQFLANQRITGRISGSEI